MMTSGTARSAAVLLGILALPACSTRGSRPSSPATATGASAPKPAAPPPAWLPAYSQEQQKLLALPLEAPVQDPAPRVYPDLTRFTFTGEGPVRAADPGTWADLVAQVVEQSPYLYVFRDGPESLANLTALFGPPPEQEPDAWKRVIARPDGELSLVPALPDPAAREHIEKTKDLEPKASLEHLRNAAEVAGSSPGVLAMLGDAALASSDLAAAEEAANKALAIDSLFPAGHRILAEVYLRRSDREKARSSIARALALYPASQRAWQVAEAIAGHEITRAVTVPQPFIEVNGAGAVMVVTCNKPLCERYAACKAAMRHEPPFRQAVLNERPDVPYHLSATEEVVCLQSGIGAHLRARSDPSGPPEPDPTAELLWRLAQQKGLTSYAMFEILGRNRPEWLRVAPKGLHDAITAYVLERVLANPLPSSPAQPGTTVITAGIASPGGHAAP